MPIKNQEGAAVSMCEVWAWGLLGK